MDGSRLQQGSTAVNHLKLLPTEILIKIFCHLPFDTRSALGKHAGSEVSEFAKPGRSLHGPTAAYGTTVCLVRRSRSIYSRSG